jgi:phage repressor protein C with HTH and peptisase S24 domain
LQRDFSTGGVRVLSYNPDYPPQLLEGAQANRLRICGRVVWHGGEL